MVRERPARAAREVPHRRGRDLRRQLPGRRYRCGLHRHQRGQCRADHDPAQGAHRHRRDREAGAVDRACDGAAAAAGALRDGWRADPVHDVPLRAETAWRRGRSGRDAHRPGRQRSHADAGGGPARDAALHPLRRLHEPLRRVPADRRPRLRRGLSRPDGCRADAGVRRPAQGARARPCLHHERALRGGLPGGDPAADPAARLARPQLARGAGADHHAHGHRPMGVRRPPAAPLSAGERDGRPRDAPVRAARLDQLAAAGRGWTAQRDFPTPPAQTFMAQYRARQSGKGS